MNQQTRESARDLLHLANTKLVLSRQLAAIQQKDTVLTGLFENANRAKVSADGALQELQSQLRQLAKEYLAKKDEVREAMELASQSAVFAEESAKEVELNRTMGLEIFGQLTQLNPPPEKEEEDEELEGLLVTKSERKLGKTEVTWDDVLAFLGHNPVVHAPAPRQVPAAPGNVPTPVASQHGKNWERNQRRREQRRQTDSQAPQSASVSPVSPVVSEVPAAAATNQPVVQVPAVEVTPSVADTQPIRVASVPVSLEPVTVQPVDEPDIVILPEEASADEPVQPASESGQRIVFGEPEDIIPQPELQEERPFAPEPLSSDDLDIPPFLRNHQARLSQQGQRSRAEWNGVEMPLAQENEEQSTAHHGLPGSQEEISEEEFQEEQPQGSADGQPVDEVHQAGPAKKMNFFKRLVTPVDEQ